MLMARARVMPVSFGRNNATMITVAAAIRRPDTPGAPTVASMSVTITAAACVPSDPMRTIRTGAAGRARNVFMPWRVSRIWVLSRGTRESVVHAGKTGHSLVGPSR